MRECTVRSLRLLRKRINWFLASRQTPRYETRQFLETVSAAGNVAIFGGFLRDLAFAGCRYFDSDVDAVIDAKDTHLLGRILHSYNHKKNKFGGYRIQLSRSSVDLWTLESTWAFQVGLVQGSSFADLARTTFFDWDAIAFELRFTQPMREVGMDLSSASAAGAPEMFTECAMGARGLAPIAGRFHFIDGYIDRLSGGTVDINLPDNPNLLGAVIRTLRLAVPRKAALSKRLAAHLHEHLPSFESSTICRVERGSFRRSVLSPESVDETRILLAKHLESDSSGPFLLPSAQLQITERGELATSTLSAFRSGLDCPTTR